MRTALLAVLGLFTLLGVGCDKSITENDIEFASLAEVKQLVDASKSAPKATLIVDPRSESAYAAGRIPGAVNIALPSIREDDDPDPAITAYAQIVVYGDNPASPPARAMTKRLLAAGYKETRLFAGGLEEWKSAQFPIETGPPTHSLPPRRRLR
jgi:rhodanese-related sulfurtransferase